MDEKPAPRPTRRPIWETLAIFLAIASIWPAYVLGRAEPVWKWLCYAMLAVMVVVLVRRLRAFQGHATDGNQERQSPSAGPPPSQERLPRHHVRHLRHLPS